MHGVALSLTLVVADVQSHAGSIRPPTASRFSRVLSVGIGGSALGPMFVADALGNVVVNLATKRLWKRHGQTLQQAKTTFLVARRLI